MFLTPFFTFLLLLSLLIIFVLFFQWNRGKFIKSRDKFTWTSQKNSSAIIIFLHGSGLSKKQWEKAFFEMVGYFPYLGKFSHIKVIFPQAPLISFTYYGGKKLPGWFNIIGKPGDDFLNIKFDQQSLTASISKIEKIIQKEIKSGIPAKRIMVIGFSQGAALALSIALSLNYPIAGFVGFGSYLPCHENLVRRAKKNNKETPIFLGHGQQDRVVPLWIAEEVAKLLKNEGYSVRLKKYPKLGHEVNWKVLKNIASRISKILPTSN